MIVIVDIDGTLMNIEHRRHFVENGNNDWHSFLEPEVMANDTPNWEVAKVVAGLNSTVSNRVICVSARNERHREVTLSQMEQCGLGECFLFLRADDDFRADDEFKLDVLNELRAADMEPNLVFDDRNRVVEMWRREGVTCFQVAEGDF